MAVFLSWWSTRPAGGRARQRGHKSGNPRSPEWEFSRARKCLCLSLFGTAGCPHTREMREWLEWRGCAFVEYDVELDPGALARMRELSGGQRIVPVLIEDGK